MADQLMPGPPAEAGRRSRGKSALLLGCGGLFALLIVGVLGYLSWANHLPSPEVDQRVLPQRNGFDAVNAAVAKFVRNRAWSPTDPRQANIAALRPVVAQDRQAVRALREALKLEFMVPAIPDSSALFPYLAQYREASRRLMAASRVARADSDAAGSAAHALDAIELGSKTGRGGSLIHNLVGIACSAIGSAALEPVVPELSADEARAAGRRLDRILQQFPTAADAIREERRLGLAGIRSMFRTGITPAVSAGAESPVTPPSPSGAYYPKPWIYAELNRAYTAQIAEVEKPFPQRRPIPPSNEPHAAELMPALDAAAFAFLKNEATLRLLRLELALQEYRQRHGGYPARLEELAPATTAAVRKDPFSDQPFVYRRQGATYLLYSLGPDLRDDGGLPILAETLEPSARGDLVAGQLFRPMPLK